MPAPHAPESGSVTDSGWADLSPVEVVRRTRCLADEMEHPAAWRFCCDLIRTRLEDAAPVPSAPQHEALRGRVEALRELSERATKGPWAVERDCITAVPSRVGSGIAMGCGMNDWTANRPLIVASVNLVRDLLAAPTGGADQGGGQASGLSAAARRAAWDLLKACEADCSGDDIAAGMENIHDLDSEPVGTSSDGPTVVTFGHMRRLRRALGALDAQHPDPQEDGTGGGAAPGTRERCPTCNRRFFTPVSERKADGSFGPGPLRRCDECKTVWSPADPAPASDAPAPAGDLEALAWTILLYQQRGTDERCIREWVADDLAPDDLGDRPRGSWGKAYRSAYGLAEHLAARFRPAPSAPTAGREEIELECPRSVAPDQHASANTTGLGPGEARQHPRPSASPEPASADPATAPARGDADRGEIADLLRRMRCASGSEDEGGDCTCRIGGGSPDWQSHDQFCAYRVICEARDAILARQPAQACGAETFETIAAWAEATFGPITPQRMAERAAEEMAELVADPSRVEEAADVVISLARHRGLWATVERKMAVNRGRTWRLMGDGTGYHVRDTSAATDPTASPATTEAGEPTTGGAS